MDLDGTGAGASPTIGTSSPISLSAGQYALSFDISGNQRNLSPDTWNLSFLLWSPLSTIAKSASENSCWLEGSMGKG